MRNSRTSAKSAILILFTVVLIFFSGCSLYSTEQLTDYITPPEIKTAPLEGTWTVTRCTNLKFEPLPTDNKDTWIGKTAEFSREIAAIGEYLWEKPSYKLKKVITEDFFLYNFKIPVPDIGIKSSLLDVVTVSGEENFNHEFVKISDSEIFISLDESVLFLTKTSDKTEGKPELLNKDTYSNAGISNTNDLLSRDTCILIGFKSEEKDPVSSKPCYSYKTMLISFRGNCLDRILQMKDILLPRKTGFWKIEIDRKHYGNNSFEDLLQTYRLFIKSPEKISPEKEEPSTLVNGNGQLVKSISYIGNDYISLDINKTFSLGKDSEILDSRLRLQPVDSIHIPQGVKISDFFPVNGSSILKSSKISFLNKQFPDGNFIEINPGSSEDNIGLYRKAGHWYMKGRMGIKSTSGVTFHDYKLNLLAPSEIVYFDKLCIPWQKIKDKVPEAVDVYTSPNNKIAVIITANKLIVYEINNGNLSNSPVSNINLGNNNTVVMAEWAEGLFVGRWRNYFMLNDYTYLN